jgi:hypothetical protein
MTEEVLSSKPMSYAAQQKALHHQGIEDAAQDSIKAVGLILDFDDDINPATQQRLKEILRALVVIRHKNRVIKEHNP